MRDPRNIEQVREHYAVERELASRLRDSTAEERERLYNELYDELLRRVPHHPMLTRKATAETTATVAAMRLLKPFLGDTTTFLEVGPGDCGVAFAVARCVRHVYAVDVSEEITSSVDTPPNFELILSNGRDVPVPPATIDVAYSNQLMEHLHPDDAVHQLRAIHQALVPGGCYVLVTPNGATGPHDVSRYFSDEPTGFHLKEYRIAELHDLLLKVGFRSVRAGVRVKCWLWIPTQPLEWLEQVVDRLPRRIARRVAETYAGRKLLANIVVVARK